MTHAFCVFCFFFFGGGRETVESDGGAFATLSQHGAASTARSSPPSKRRRLDSKVTGATASSSSSSRATEAYAHPTEVLGVDAEDESDDDNDVIDGVPFDNGHSIGSAASASNARGAVPDARLITLVDEQLAAVASQLSRIGIGDISTVRRTTLPHIHIVLVPKKTRSREGTSGWCSSNGPSIIGGGPEAPHQCPLEVALYFHPIYADVRYIADVITFLLR